MSGEEIIEEFNPWERAITSTEAAMVLLLVFWIILAIALGHDKITEATFKEMFLDAGIVTILLKLIGKK